MKRFICATLLSLTLVFQNIAFAGTIYTAVRVTDGGHDSLEVRLDNYSGMEKMKLYYCYDASNVDSCAPRGMTEGYDIQVFAQNDMIEPQSSAMKEAVSSFAYSGGLISLVAYLASFIFTKKITERHVAVALGVGASFGAVVGISNGVETVKQTEVAEIMMAALLNSQTVSVEVEDLRAFINAIVARSEKLQYRLSQY